MSGFKDVIDNEKRSEAKRKEGMKSTAEKITVPVRDGNSIDTFYFKSSNPGKAPAMFHIHGGGFVWGDAELDYKYCEKLRDDLGMNVISIQYRLAPENPYPGQTNDCFDAISYFFKNADKYNIDRNRCAVCGESAGGNLAAVICMLAKETGEFKIASQVLIYPFIDLVSDPRGKKGNPMFQPPEWAEWFLGFNDAYTIAEQRNLKYVSPVCAEAFELKGLPAAIIITGSEDSLCAEGQKYAELLEKAGVTVHSETIEGAPHGFVSTGLDPDYMDMLFPDSIPKEYKEAGIAQFKNWANIAMSTIKEQLTAQLGL